MSTWLSSLRQAAHARPGGSARVVAFPHAGAGPHALLPVLGELPGHLDVLGVTLPGRERRFAEPWTRPDPDRAVAAVAEELRDLPRRPTVLFGHSLGAAMAAAVAAHTPEVCDAVVLSAYPGGGSAEQRDGRWDDRELWEIIESGGATPPEVLASRAWREYLLELLRADLTLGSRLAVSTASRVLPVPVTVLTPDDDELAAGTSLAPGGSPLTHRRFPGGHFYLLDDATRHSVAAEITAAIDRGGHTTSIPSRMTI